MAEKAELVITALQQRIGELELDKAILRAEITQLLDEKKDREKAIQEYSDSLNNITN
jgi:predicted  nucleic acid-binding Zn-ribbon protein